MPRKTNNKPAKKAEWKGYHKVNLTKEQEEAFEVWAKTAEILFSDFDVVVNSGYKLSFGWDDYHSGASASLYCNQAKMDWAGYTLSAWAADVETAVKLLFYKHFEICKGMWDVAEERTERSHSKFG